VVWMKALGGCRYKHVQTSTAGLDSISVFTGASLDRLVCTCIPSSMAHCGNTIIEFVG
jgi:hypothetical protein